METPPDEAKRITSGSVTPSVSRDPVSHDPDSHDECDSHIHEDSSTVDSSSTTRKKKKHHRHHKKSHRIQSSTDSSQDLVAVSSRSNILSDPLYLCLRLPFPIRQSKPDTGIEMAPETEDPGLKGLASESDKKLEDDLDAAPKTPPETDGQGLASRKTDEKLDASSAVKMEDEPELLRENALLAAMLNDLIKFLEITRGNRACLEDNESEGESNLKSPEPSKGGGNRSPPSPSSGFGRRTPPPKSGASPTRSPAPPKSPGSPRSPKSPKKRAGNSSGKTGGEKFSNAPLIRFSSSASSVTLLSTETTDNSKDSGEPERSKLQDQFYSCLEIEPLVLQSGESSGEPNQTCDTAPPSVDDEESSHPNNESPPTRSASKNSCWPDVFSPIEVVSRYIQTECWNERSESSAQEVAAPVTARRSATKNFNEACYLEIPTLEKRESEGSSVEEFDRIFASYSAAKEKERARTDVKAVVHDSNFNSTPLSLPVYDERHIMAQSGSA